MMTRAFNPATDFPALVELLNDVAKADSGTPVTLGTASSFSSNNGLSRIQKKS
jgi:hypothetical protein